MTVDIAALDRARRDPAVFAEVLIGQPLWDHQREVVESEAKYSVICAGRRAGKTHVFGVMALHRAFSQSGSKVLIVSSGEDAAKNMFAAVAEMTQGSEWLRSSVVDDLTQSMTLSNGSVIRCVSSSMRQVRSQEADLLIVDEAGFVTEEIWDAVEPVTVARPGSRILVCSSPWGGPGSWFHDLWRQGMDRPSKDLRSWHWPSTVSPMVNQAQLESIRARKSSWSYGREYLAEWTDTSGAYFTEAELSAAVADYPLMSPERALEAGGQWVDGPGYLPVFEAVAGVDWGFNRDANAVVLLAAAEDFGLNDELLGEGVRPLFIPWLEWHERLEYMKFVDRLVEVAGSYDVQVIASERNGVGASPTQALDRAVRGSDRARAWVRPVWTDARRKMSGFGKLKGLLQRQQLVLPRHPELLKQLRGLEFAQTESGLTKIAVPERSGHDDLAMALLQAVSCLQTDPPRWSSGLTIFDAPAAARDVWSVYARSAAARRAQVAAGALSVVSTESGIRLPEPVRPCEQANRWWRTPEGDESGDGW